MWRLRHGTASEVIEPEVIKVDVGGELRVRRWCEGRNGSVLAGVDVMARKARKAVDSQATQSRAVALDLVSGIDTPLPAWLTSDDAYERRTGVPCGLRC